jgi:hypothetical protein
MSTGLPKLAAIFSIGSILANLVAFGIGTSRGLSPPTAFDFGSDSDLRQLSADHAAHLVPLVLSLLSPCLAIPAGLGWWHVLGRAGWPALFGIVMFYVGMIFVVLLDVLELVSIMRLAPAYDLVSEAARPALLGFASTVELTRATLRHIGHFFGFALGQLALGVAVLREPSLPRWLGWLSFVPAVLIGWLATVLELSGRSAGPAVPVGILAFVVWVLAMAVVLLRWKLPIESARSRNGATLS